jgi:signal transduction histidine kinase
MIVAEPRRVVDAAAGDLVLSTKPVTVVPALATAAAPPAAPAVAFARGPTVATATVPAPAQAPVPAQASVTRRARNVGAWALATPWVMGIVLLLSAYLAWFTVDLLQNRLHESSVKFDATSHHFERFWTLHDAATESTLAIKWDLAAAGTLPSGESLQRDALRFVLSSNALRAEIAEPGPLLLSQGPSWTAAVAALADSLQRERGTADRALVRAQAQAALDGLVRIEQEARQRQSMAAVFLDEVEGVRHQVLIAFSVIVAMLVLVAALATQWVLVARRERAIRGRAEHLAEVAEAERARAETVARDKARFLGMLSHELLTPLQSIWSTMDVIESRGRVDASDPAFTRLKESTRSLRGRISDLVDFAKMSSGRLETRIRGFQLDKLVDTALRDVEEALAHRNLDVHWEAGPELSQRIYSDPARLRQVIDNLLTNAIKYTERGGISINAELRRDQGLLRVEISDTGVGIDPDEMARLFEPFYRSPQTAGMAEGSGLGLAVVRSLVDLMGGTIRVDSRVGQGTSVTVEVPITEGTDGLADAPLRIETRLPVLVVDDSRDARRAIADVIRALGIEVVEAIDAATGLAAAAERDYQAIFLDMQMPDLTGYEVARRLRKPGDRHQKTFLVLISAYMDLDDATVDSVFDARIDKPASRKDLMAALGRAAQALG